VENPDYAADVIIAGAGLAGLASAYELIERGRKVVLIDKDGAAALGGLARLSFGGICMGDTPEQRRMGIADSPELLHRDWLSFARFGEGPEYENPRQWARLYAENSHQIYEFLSHKKIRFLPVVNWTERGLFTPGNSVPRWHITWGTGWEIIDKLVKALDCHPQRQNLQLLFDHEVNNIDFEGGRVVGVSGSGKSWFASKLAGVLKTRYLQMDQLYWQPNWTEPTVEEFREIVRQAINQETWVLDGNYHSKTKDLKWEVTTLVVWIDQSFVADISHDADDRAIIDAILSMSMHFGFNVVAEGVETREQYEFLVQHGCKRFQGFHFERPLPAEDFTHKLFSGDHSIH